MYVQVVRDKTEWKGVFRFSYKKLYPVNLRQEE